MPANLDFAIPHAMVESGAAATPFPIDPPRNWSGGFFVFSFGIKVSLLFRRADARRNEAFMEREPLSETTVEPAELVELGIALGQTNAFGLVAGRCSAAQAEGIRRLREEKLYKRCCEKWDDFCPKYLRMSRSEADRTIKLWEEFGPAYFELSQLTRVPQSGRGGDPDAQHDSEKVFRHARADAGPERFYPRIGYPAAYP